MERGDKNILDSRLSLLVQTLWIPNYLHFFSLGLEVYTVAPVGIYRLKKVLFKVHGLKYVVPAKQSMNGEKTSSFCHVTSPTIVCFLYRLTCLKRI